MKFINPILYLFLLLVNVLISLEILAQNHSELKYLKISPFESKGNIAHHINEILKKYIPLQEFLLSSKGAPSHQEVMNSIDDSLSHKSHTRPSNTFSLLKKWSLSKKSMMEQYYGVYDLHECLLPQSQMDIQPPFDLRKFAQLQADFFTYFKYSVAASLITKEDIENEVINFINYHNLLLNKCHLGLSSKATIVQLYSQFIEKVLIPLVQNDYLIKKKLLAIADTIQWGNANNLDNTIFAEYSVALNKLNDSWSKKVSSTIFPAKYVYSKDLFNKDQSKELLDQYYRRLLRSSSQYFSKSSLGPVHDFFKGLSQNVQQIEHRKTFKESNIIGKKAILSYKQMDAIIPINKIIHFYNMNVTRLYYLVNKKIYPEKMKFSKQWEIAKLPKNPETHSNYIIDTQKNLIQFQQWTVPL